MENTELLNDNIKLLIISYLTGSITEDEMGRLNEWINLSNENRICFNNLKDSWILSGEKGRDSVIKTEESWNRLRNNLSRNRFRLGLGVESREKVSFARYAKLAASWLLIFGLGATVT